jgi:hypothetical protein
MSVVSDLPDYHGKVGLYRDCFLYLCILFNAPRHRREIRFSYTTKWHILVHRRYQGLPTSYSLLTYWRGERYICLKRSIILTSSFVYWHTFLIDHHSSTEVTTPEAWSAYMGFSILTVLPQIILFYYSKFLSFNTASPWRCWWTIFKVIS